jgi:hypothetical protein
MIYNVQLKKKIKKVIYNKGQFLPKSKFKIIFYNLTNTDQVHAGSEK